jgi:hypothetical protein
MTETQRRESGDGDFPTLNQQFDIMRGALDDLSAIPESTFTKLSMGRYRYRDYVIAFSYVFGEASVSLTRFGTANVIDSYVGKEPLMWFIEGALTPLVLTNELHVRLDQLNY